MPTDDIVDEVKAAAKTARPTRSTSIPKKNFLSTGSTLLNLACSGDVHGGFPKGVFTFLVGDSSSGKSFLSLTCLAEAAASREFDDYRFVYDASENGALMNVQKFFGKKVADRLEPPAGTKAAPVYSSTVEEFYYNVDENLKKGPCIFIEDSMDALTTEDEQDRFEKKKRAHAGGKDKDVAGSYGTAKAKMNSAYLRVINNKLADTNSILLIISQTRDNIGFGAQFNPKTRAGGNALRFYTRLELWSSIRERIKKRVAGKDRQIGIVARIKLNKNHVTGWEGSVEVPIYRSLGIDDLGGCVRFLVSEGHWKAGGKKKAAGDGPAKTPDKVVAPEFGFDGGAEDLIALIQEGNREAELKQVVKQVWDDIEAGAEVPRKRRYT